VGEPALEFVKIRAFVPAEAKEPPGIGAPHGQTRVVPLPLAGTAGRKSGRYCSLAWAEDSPCAWDLPASPCRVPTKMRPHGPRRQAPGRPAGQRRNLDGHLHRPLREAHRQ
jgi:hypothetical protein